MSGAESHLYTYDGQDRQERTLFEIAFEHAPIPSALLGRDGQFLAVNPAFCRFIGYDKAELMHLTYRKICHPEDLPFAQIYAQRLVSGEISTFQIETRYVHKGGATIWGQLHIAAVPAGSHRALPFSIAQIVDITKNKATEASMRRLKSFYDNSSEGIAIFDLEGCATHVNTAYQRMIGYSEEELVGKRIPFNPANATPDVMTLISEETKGHYLHNCEVTVIRKDCSPIWVSVTTSPVHSDDGAVVGTAVIARDITQRKLAQQRLSETIKLQNIIFENSSDIISYCSTDGTCLYISPAVYASLGYDPSEVTGCLTQDYLHPDDVERVAQTFHSLLSADAAETIFTVRLRHKNGNYRWYETQAKLHLNQSNSSAIVAVSRDVSEEMRLQESLEHAVRVARLGHFDWDLAADCVLHSSQGYEILGLKQDGSTVNYMRFLQLVHVEDRAMVQHAIEKAIDIGGQFDRIFRIVRPDGTVRYLHSQGEILFDDDGVALRMIGIFQDITARRLLEQQLLESDKRYQLLVENSLDGIGVVEAGKWAYLNKAGLDLFGACAPEQLIGRDVVDFVHCDEQESTLQRLQALVSGESVRLTQQEFLKLNGEVFFAETVGTAMGDSTVQLVFRGVSKRPLAHGESQHSLR